MIEKERLFDWLCTTIFAYLLFASALVIRFSGFASRIDLLGFLIPHSTKVVLWSFIALFWLRPRFGWRYPFAMLMLYCSAELLTNWIYVVVHFSDLASVWALHIPLNLFILSEVFFLLGIVLCLNFLKGHFILSLDWAMLPFVVFLGFWIATGYETESTIGFPSYWLETEELIWNVLYLIMATQIFKPIVATRPRI